MQFLQETNMLFEHSLDCWTKIIYNGHNSPKKDWKKDT